MRIVYLFIIAAILIHPNLMAAPSIQNSATYEELQKLTAGDKDIYSWFGYSVAMDGDYAIVGARGDGSAYIFKNDGSGTFTQTDKLSGNDTVSGDAFGISVAISGDYAIVGAHQDNDYTGSAYIFKNDGSGNFTQTDKLTANDAAVDSSFGYSVAMSGDYAIIGAYIDNNYEGSAYIFKKDGNGHFTQIAKLTAGDAAMNDWFGRSVSISGDYAIIGADGSGTGGSAYLFKRDSNDYFTQIAKLTASDGTLNDAFGYSVAISGDYMIIAARDDDDKGSDSGSAYIFKNDGSGTFTQTAKLTAGDGAADDEFGYSVAISGDYAIVGARYNDDNGNESGSAYIFKNNGSGTFTQTDKLTAGDAAADDSFGVSVATNGVYTLIGSYGDDNVTGSAYIFNGVIRKTAEENRTDFTLDIDASGAIGYTISGVDSALFNINALTGVITFKTAPDYESPMDDNRDNVYELRVEAFDGISSDIKIVEITVTNVVEFSRDNTNDTVRDDTNLTWQDNADVATRTMPDQASATAYCNELVFAGVDDWYLPSMDQLKTTVDIANTPKIDAAFENVDTYYWSSAYSYELMSYEKGNKVSYKDTYSIYTRCIREGAIHNTPATAITLSSDTLQENASAGTLIGILSAVDADVNDTHTYELTCNDANFSVTSDGNLSSKVVFDYDATPSQSVCVRATDAFGLSFEENLSVTILALPRTSVDFTTLSPIVTSQKEYLLSFKVNDPEGDTLSISVTTDHPELLHIAPATLEVQAAGYDDALNFTLGAAGHATGTASVTVTVSGATGSTVESFEIVIEAVHGLSPSLMLYLLH